MATHLAPFRDYTIVRGRENITKRGRSPEDVAKRYALWYIRNHHATINPRHVRAYRIRGDQYRIEHRSGQVWKSLPGSEFAVQGI